MACSVHIIAVSGVGPNGLPASSITVTGTAAGCAANTVDVKLVCGQPFPSTLTVAVDVFGKWSAVFLPPATGGALCVCGSPITVVASCHSDPACQDTFSGQLQCGTSGCPTVNATASVGPCNPDGTRTVTLDAIITPNAGVVTEWELVTLLGAVSGSPNHQTRDCAPGTYTAILHVILPTSCPDVPLPVTVDACQQPPCPEVTNLTAGISGCAGLGNQATVDFSGTLTPPQVGCTFLWNFGDGHTGSSAMPSISHPYSDPGTYAVNVNAICPGGCIQSATITVVILACCPILTTVDASISGCVGSGSMATATIVATTNPPAAAGSYTWTFDDGSQAFTSTPSPPAHAYTTTGSHVVQVSFQPSMAGCVATTGSASFVVPECTGNGGNGEGFGCRILRAVLVILAILAAVLAFIFFCVPGAQAWLGFVALAVAAASLLDGVIWAIFCPKPCLWGLLFAWQVALGSGIGALGIAGCCPVMWWVGSSLILAGIAGMLAWASRCHQTRCQVLLELLVVFTGAAIPVFAWVAQIPLLSGCLNSWVATGIATLAALITIGLAGCGTSGRRT